MRTEQPFPTTAEVAGLLEHADSSAVLILQRVLPRPEEARRLREACAAVVFDFDDAIYATPPQIGGARLPAAGRASWRPLTRGSAQASSCSRPLKRLLRHVDLCVAGNSILARFAERHGAPGWRSSRRPSSHSRQPPRSRRSRRSPGSACPRTCSTSS